MERWVGKVAIVTGANMGIGAAITENLLNLGVTVVGVARREEKLLELSQKFKTSKGKFYPMKADITLEQDILNVFERAQNIGPIHILVNNASIYAENGLLDGTTKDWKNTFDTNVLGLCVATREAIKNMRENNVDGHIIHIGSIEYRLPGTNVYLASKQAVKALTETLRQELNSINSKIKVSCINPGLVRTESSDPKIGQTKNTDLVELYTYMPLLEATDIASAAVYVLSTPPHVQVHELTIRPIGETI